VFPSLLVYAVYQFLSVSPAQTKSKRFNVRLPIGISGLILADKTNNTQKKFLKDENIAMQLFEGCIKSFHIRIPVFNNPLS